MQDPVVVGIDYSFTCPSICIAPAGVPFIFDLCEIYFKHDNDKRLAGAKNITNVHGERHKKWQTEQQRFWNISWWVMDILSRYNVKLVAIEGYAFGAKGKVFEIGENTGLLKHNLWMAEIPFVVVPPTVVKKLATGKGNAKKEDVYTAFLKETETDIAETIGTKNIKDNSPTGDIVDSYYICKWAINNLS